MCYTVCDLLEAKSWKYVHNTVTVSMKLLLIILLFFGGIMWLKMSESNYRHTVSSSFVTSNFLSFIVLSNTSFHDAGTCSSRSSSSNIITYTISVNKIMTYRFIAQFLHFCIYLYSDDILLYISGVPYITVTDSTRQTVYLKFKT